jgi:hypothetical protein
MVAHGYEHRREDPLRICFESKANVTGMGGLVKSPFGHRCWSCRTLWFYRRHPESVRQLRKSHTIHSASQLRFAFGTSFMKLLVTMAVCVSSPR